MRVSTKGQADDDKDGLPRQLEDIEEFCKPNGLTLEGLNVVEHFRLTGISGSYVDRSPQFQRMLKRLEEPDIDGIVVAEIDRLFRPAYLSSNKIFEPFEQHEKTIYCRLGALKPWTQEGMATIGLWGMVAGIEKRNIRERMKRGKDKSRRNPNRVSDPLPFFVEAEPIDDAGNVRFKYNDQADRLALAFKRYDNGDTLRQIGIDLGFGSVAALRVALKNHWALGFKQAIHHRDYGKQRRTNADGELMDATRRVKRAEPILTRTNLADSPLIEKRLFDRVQIKLDSNHRSWETKKSRANTFLGSGLLLCSCGEKMYHKMDNRPNKPNYYRCSTNSNEKVSCGAPTLNAAVVDHEIMFSVMSYFNDPKVIERNIRQHQSTESRSLVESQIAVAEKLVGQLRTKLNRAVKNSIERGDLYLPYVDQYTKELKQAEQDLALLNDEAEHSLTNAQVKQTAKQLADIFLGFASWPIEKQKATLREHLAGIFMQDGKAELIVKTGLPYPRFASELARRANVREGVLAVAGLEAEVE